MTDFDFMPNVINTMTTVNEYCQRWGIPLEYYEQDQKYYLKVHNIGLGSPSFRLYYLNIVIIGNYPQAVPESDLQDEYLVWCLGTVFDQIQNIHNQPL